MYFTLVTVISPKILQSCLIVETPIVATVNKPTHLLLTVHPNPIPEQNNQKYQLRSNDL